MTSGESSTGDGADPLTHEITLRLVFSTGEPRYIVTCICGWETITATGATADRAARRHRVPS